MALLSGAGSQTLAALSATLSRRGRGKSGGRNVHELPEAILMVDAKCRAGSLAAIPALPRGSAVLLRDYHNPGRRLLARRLLQLCRRHRLRLIMAAASREDVEFALGLGVHGLHVPQAALYAPARILGGSISGALGRFPSQWILTASVHSRAALVVAAHRRFHAALLSPVFPTTSHPDCATLGPLRFSILARNAPLPVYALGGIHAGNVRRLAHSGTVGIAAIEGFALEGLVIPPSSP